MTKVNKGRWTKEEDDYLRKNYKKMSDVESVERKLNELNL